MEEGIGDTTQEGEMKAYMVTADGGETFYGLYKEKVDAEYVAEHMGANVEEAKLVERLCRTCLNGLLK